MSEHTPGPWTAELTEDGMHWHIGADFVVAECPAGNPAWDANAHLIAASPDLLEVVFDALNLIISSGATHRGLTVVTKARAAIAKAEGRQP